mgnify:CR=1 FL=1
MDCKRPCLYQVQIRDNLAICIEIRDGLQVRSLYQVQEAIFLQLAMRSRMDCNLAVHLGAYLGIYLLQLASSLRVDCNYTKRSSVPGTEDLAIGIKSQDGLQLWRFSAACFIMYFSP